MDALSLLPDDLTRVGSRSRLVIVSAQRARQFMQGIPSSIVTKLSTIHVKFLVGKDARQAMKEAKKQRERELERLAVARVAGEDASEIKKDLSVMVDDSKPVEPGEED